MNTTPEKKPFYLRLIKPVAILLALIILLQAVYALMGTISKSSIQSGVQTHVSSLMTRTESQEVEVHYRSEPNQFRFPWEQEFHIFLTVHVQDLRQFDQSRLVSILSDDQKDTREEYSYSYSLSDYAHYARTVTDCFGKTHPVFVTITDGERSSYISHNNYNFLLKSGNQRILLNAPSQGMMPTILYLLILAFVALLVFLLWKNILWQREQKALARQEALQKSLEGHSPLERILLKIDSEIEDELQAQAQAVRLKKLLYSLAAFAVVILAGFLAINMIVIPQNTYNQALAQLNAGNVDAAYAAFSELGNFRDSDEKCRQIDYSRAEQYLAAGQNKDAFLTFLSLEDYSDAATRAEALRTANPYLSFFLAAPGDIIAFGEYEQDNDPANGMEPIEWIVLENQGGKVYVLSKYILDAQPFNIYNTHNCTLDEWLNTEFSSAAFEEEDIAIISRIGLMPEDYLGDYGLSHEQICSEYTRYAKAQDPYSGFAAGLMWWLTDDDLFESGGDISAPVVWENGVYGAHSCDVVERCGVRPAIWLFADEEDLPVDYTFSGNSPTPRKSSSSSSSSNRPCYGGSVSCRAGFHPCHQMDNGFCNQCCKD